MSTVKKIEPKVVPTTDSCKSGTELLHCFLPGDKIPKNASSKLQAVKIIIDATRVLKELGLDDPTLEDYARYFRLLNNKTLVKNVLNFCSADTEGKKQLQAILSPPKEEAKRASA